MKLSRIVRIPAVVMIVVGMLAVASPALSQTDSGVPEPKESIKAPAKKLKKALKSGDCQTLGKILRHSSLRVNEDDPSQPVEPTSAFTDDECTGVEAFAAALKGFKLKRSKEYGTGALVEGTAGGEDIVITFVLDTDGKWRAIGSGPLSGQIGTSSTLDFAGSASGFVTAIHTGDCFESWRLLTVDSPYVVAGAETGGATTWCNDVTASLSGGSGRIFDIASATEEPEEFGATTDIAFFGLELPSGRYVTLILFSEPFGETEHAEPGVFDFVNTRLPNG